MSYEAPHCRTDLKLNVLTSSKHTAGDSPLTANPETSSRTLKHKRVAAEIASRMSLGEESDGAGGRPQSAAKLIGSGANF